MHTSLRSGGQFLIAIALLGTVLGCSLPWQQREAAAPAEASPTGLPAVSSSPAPPSPATLPPSPSPSPALPAPPPSPSPSPSAETALVVRGTGADGLLVRREPGGERVALAGEGQRVVDLGDERQADGRTWRRVRAPDGTEGWAAAEFLASPDSVPSQPTPVPTSTPTSPSQPAATNPQPNPGVRAPEYGMNVFLAGNASTTGRDLDVLNRLGFTWQKSLFQWRQIEGEGKGVFDWRDADRVVAASRGAGVKIVARLDFQPRWARADRATNGPPDDYQDYADFVRAFVDRYRTGSLRGTVHAIEVWNEPNIDREWGGESINPQQAADYVRLLKAAYQAAKLADPAVTVVSAGLSPTCTDDDKARPDDLYLQWLYDAGAAPYFDALGAHGAGYDKPPSASPDESAAKHNGCRVFTFRRVEDLRAVMERNGDAATPVWLLEFGWTTDRQNPAYAWHAVSPETHGEYVVDAYRWAHDHWSPWIGVMALWNLPDPNWTRDREEFWWGIANPDGSPGPALTRLLAARQDGRLP